jgi:hypothetical protein
MSLGVAMHTYADINLVACLRKEEKQKASAFFFARLPAKDEKDYENGRLC